MGIHGPMKSVFLSEENDIQIEWDKLSISAEHDLWVHGKNRLSYVIYVWMDMVRNAISPKLMMQLVPIDRS